VALAAGRCGSGQNPDGAGGGVGRGSVWRGARVAMDWFRSGFRAEMAGGEVSGGARRRQPLRAQSRRGGQRGGAARKGGSTSECYRSRRTG
jgi:hypothetical protein